MHIKEYKLTSNTAKICQKALTNSEIFIRGSRFQQSFKDTYKPKLDHKQLYLFPTDDSVALSANMIKEISLPIELVVPDATWSQAIKFHKREPILEKMQKVHIINQKKSIYDLRAQIHEGGLCTLEAVAYALDIIENSYTKNHLLDILKVMNLRNLKARQRI